MLYLYFGNTDQLGLGQAYTCLSVSRGIGLKLGPCPFDFSCLLKFDVAENVLLRFTLWHGTTILLKAKILFSGLQKQTKD